MTRRIPTITAAILAAAVALGALGADRLAASESLPTPDGVYGRSSLFVQEQPASGSDSEQEQDDATAAQTEVARPGSDSEQAQGDGATAQTEGAQQRSWRIESFHADIQVRERGAMEVTETIRLRFDGQYRGIYRRIPTEYSTAGSRVRPRLSVEGVTDEAGNPLEYTTDRDGRYREIRILVPGAVDTTRTVRLDYRIANGIIFFEANDDLSAIVDSYDELYWNVTGTEWPVPIDAASATVSLPPAVTGIRANAFTGSYGSAEQNATVRIAGPRIEARSDRPLGFREGLTVAIAWDAGVVRRPTAIDRAAMYLAANWPLFLPFIVFAFIYRRWNERGRDPETGPVQPRAEPPAGLSPGEVGVIVDNRADLRDITATLVDLAIRGHLVIEEAKDEDGQPGKDYLFRRCEDGAARQDALVPHEAALLQALLGDDDSRHLSKLRNKFYKKLPALQSQLLHALVENDIYEESPAKLTRKYVGVAFIVGIAIFFGGAILQNAMQLAPLAVTMAAVASALVIAVFAFIMPSRTTHGTEVLRQVKGFEEFLKIESDSSRRLVTGASMFERYLPYAIALGVESQWADAFREIYREPPKWYVGRAFPAFDAYVFVAALNAMSAETHSVIQSAPRSAGTSAFTGGTSGISGGGISGGGMGGGGGGAF